MAKKVETIEVTATQDDMLMVRLVATFAAATRLSGKKMSTVDSAADDTITLAKKLEKYILEG